MLLLITSQDVCVPPESFDLIPVPVTGVVCCSSHIKHRDVDTTRLTTGRTEHITSSLWLPHHSSCRCCRKHGASLSLSPSASSGQRDEANTMYRLGTFP